jgi:hypothetical protein
MSQLQNKLRELLTGTDGMTTRQLGAYVDSGMRDITRALKVMPDAYIDRWQVKNRGQYAAVWCVVDVPENCPRPG